MKLLEISKVGSPNLFFPTVLSPSPYYSWYNDLSFFFCRQWTPTNSNSTMAGLACLSYSIMPTKYWTGFPDFILLIEALQQILWLYYIYFCKCKSKSCLGLSEDLNDLQLCPYKGIDSDKYKSWVYFSITHLWIAYFKGLAIPWSLPISGIPTSPSLGLNLNLRMSSTVANFGVGSSWFLVSSVYIGLNISTQSSVFSGFLSSELPSASFPFQCGVCLSSSRAHLSIQGYCFAPTPS